MNDANNHLFVFYFILKGASGRQHGVITICFSNSSIKWHSKPTFIWYFYFHINATPAA